MKKILVVCRTGMGSSMLLKIKVEQVISALNLDAEVYHDVTSAMDGYNGPIVALIITAGFVANLIIARMTPFKYIFTLIKI